MSTYFKSGTWNCICQVCGREYKSDQVRKRWDGLIVCEADFEQRHIADFIRAHPERGGVPYTSPEPTDVFVFVCNFPNTVGMADTGVADCSMASFSAITVPE